jgi:hypothetical protein
LGNRNRNCICIFHDIYLYFVFKVQSDSQYDNELVVEDYYKKEATFQGNIRKKSKMPMHITEKVVIKPQREGIKIDFSN